VQQSYRQTTDRHTDNRWTAHGIRRMYRSNVRLIIIIIITQFSITHKSPLHVECIEIRQLADCIDFCLICSFRLTKHCGRQHIIPILATNQLCGTDKNFSTLLERRRLPRSECLLTDINGLRQTCLLHRTNNANDYTGVVLLLMCVIAASK